MWKIRSILLILLLCILCSKYATSQSTFNEVINQELYRSERSIVNGVAWTNSVRYQGNRFFGSKDWKTGHLSFEGREYRNLQINYDLLDDEIIMYDAIPGQEKYIQLDKTKIDSFSFFDNGSSKHFVSLQLNGSEEAIICERIYKGEVSYFERHKKAVQKQIGTTYMGRLYDNNTHYLKNDRGIYSFRTKKRVLEILGNSKELKKYIRKHGLNINPKSPNDIVMLIRYSETLRTVN